VAHQVELGNQHKGDQNGMQSPDNGEGLTGRAVVGFPPFGPAEAPHEVRDHRAEGRRADHPEDAGQVNTHSCPFLGLGNISWWSVRQFPPGRTTR
jgi:hypothetical protein